MEEKLNEIITKNEVLVQRFTDYQNSLNQKMQFVYDHDFIHEYKHLQTQEQAMTPLLEDYRDAIEELRNLLNAWNL
jgi:hypothetical protein